MAEEKIIEFIHLRKTLSGDWENVGEFIWRTPPEELATVYAAHQIRLKNLLEAEDNLKNYRHAEPLRIGGRTKIVDILSATSILKQPFLTTMQGETGSDKALTEIQNVLASSSEWRFKKEIGLQAIASIGWLSDITKARPPAITKDNSSTDYEEELLPDNLQIKEDSSPSGYNKQQAQILTEAQTLTIKALANCGPLHAKISDMTIVPYGELLFKTFSRIYTALPDPETEEREKFEEMRKKAAEKRAQAED